MHRYGYGNQFCYNQIDFCHPNLSVSHFTSRFIYRAKKLTVPDLHIHIHFCFAVSATAPILIRTAPSVAA